MDIEQKIESFLNESSSKLLYRVTSKYGRTIEFYVASGQVGLDKDCVVFKSEKGKGGTASVTKCYKTREEADKDINVLKKSAGKVNEDENPFDVARKQGKTPSISEFEPHAAWLKKIGKKLEDVFGEDDKKWDAWEDAMYDRGYSKADMKTFQEIMHASADKLHYYANGRPDGGHIKALLDQWSDFKKDVEATSKKWW